MKLPLAIWLNGLLGVGITLYFLQDLIQTTERQYLIALGLLIIPPYIAPLLVAVLIFLLHRLGQLDKKFILLSWCYYAAWIILEANSLLSTKLCSTPVYCDVSNPGLPLVILKFSYLLSSVFDGLWVLSYFISIFAVIVIAWLLFKIKRATKKQRFRAVLT